MEAVKILDLQKKIRELKKSYEQLENGECNYNYYNMFGYTDLLGNAINSLLQLITDNEECFGVISFKKKENGDYELVSNNEECKGKNICSYFVIGNMEEIKGLIGRRFTSKKHIQQELKLVCEEFKETEGIILPEMFNGYPEIQEFFYLLNVWRFNTGRATLDSNIVENAYNEVINNMNVQVGKGR